MRDAFGGVFMMRLMLAFITIFVGFTAVSLNYARAFRVKNEVTDLIEQKQLKEITDVINKSEYTDALDKIIKKAGYARNCKKKTLVDEEGNIYSVCYKGIIVRKSYAEEHTNKKEIYYKIITYGGWDLSVLNMLLSLGDTDPNSEKAMYGSWTISGEAKIVKYETTTAPYSDKIKDYRCYKDYGDYVYVSWCQPVTVVGARCKIENGKRVLRNLLSKDAWCHKD